MTPDRCVVQESGCARNGLVHMPEDMTKTVPFQSSETSGLIEAHLKVFSVQITSLERTVDDAFQRLEKIIEDHEKRHRDAEKERNELAKELSAANTRIVQLKVERKADAERARADMAEVKADIARLEAKLDAVTAQQLSMWQQIIVKALPVLLGVGGGGGLVVGFMELLK